MTNGNKSLFAEFRKDGWPFCPNCEKDELWCPGTTWFQEKRERTPTVEECTKMGLVCCVCQSWFGENSYYVTKWSGKHWIAQSEKEQLERKKAIIMAQQTEKRTIEALVNEVRSSLEEMETHLFGTTRKGKDTAINPSTVIDRICSSLEYCKELADHVSSQMHRIS